MTSELSWTLQPHIGPENHNPEVVLERAIAAARAAAGQIDWTKYIAVAFGLVLSA